MSPLILVLMVLHVAGGAIALGGGVIALAARKGGRRHRSAGDVFAAAMLVMGVFADILAVIVPGQATNLLGGTLALYLVCTGWLAVRPRTGAILLGERLALGFALLLWLPLLFVAVAYVIGAPMPLPGGVPRVYLATATSIFAAVVGLAVVTDIRQVRTRGVTGTARVARHLWRMTAALALNAGSAFTNGLPRLLPPSLQPPTILQFTPMLVIVALLAFWMIRLRFPPWTAASALRATAPRPVR